MCTLFPIYSFFVLISPFYPTLSVTFFSSSFTPSYTTAPPLI